MKTTSLKNAVVMAMMVTGLTMTYSAHAQSPMDEGTSTRIAPPARSANPFEEGTSTQLSGSQVEEIKKWANNSKMSLIDLLNQIKGTSYRESKRILETGIKDVIRDSNASDTKAPETIMRYVLNRSLKVVSQIEVSTNPAAVGVIDQEVRVYRRSVEMALAYYESDVAHLGSAHAGLPFARFGMEYVQFLMQINESLLNTRAAYAIAMDALGFFQVDLAKDERHEAYRFAISKIYNFVQKNPMPVPQTSMQAVNQMTRVRKTYHDTMILAKKALN